MPDMEVTEHAVIVDNPDGHHADSIMEIYLQISQAITQMEEKGMRDDPRYSTLVKLSNRIKNQMKNVSLNEGLDNANMLTRESNVDSCGSNKNEFSRLALNPQQNKVLHAQLLAYKYLARREPLPEALHYAIVYNKPLTSTIVEQNGKIVNSSLKTLNV